jgi:prevent-host-death family protein
MIVSVRESKARLSELVTKASQGEEVLITVRGKPAARIMPVATAPKKTDKTIWISKRRQQLAAQGACDSAADIIDSLREERG